jgi:transmembrane sensor
MGKKTRMKNANQQHDDAVEPLMEKALEWLVTLHSGDETEQDWQEYESWKTANNQQLMASQAAENLWASIGSAVKRPRITHVIPQVLVLLVVFVGLFGLGVQQQLFQSPARLMADHRTLKTNGKTITLKDGSLLKIDAATQLDINFSDDERRITLFSGQIHIHVASDSTRPFNVEADNINVRALGTGFNVKYDNDQVSVAVTEHSVKITNIDNNNYVKVNEGYRLQYNEKSGFSSAIPANINTITAWQRGKIIFENQPLSQVIKTIQRYNNNHIVILSDELKQHKVTGIFDINDNNGMLSIIENNLPVTIHQFPWLIVLAEK